MNIKKQKTKLEKLGGCKNCSRNCIHNGDVAFPDVAKMTKGKIFCCNDTYPEFGKKSEV